ncbi:MAG: hypothetical protein ACLSAF_03860 [Intestinimonas sp.]
MTGPDAWFAAAGAAAWRTCAYEDVRPHMDAPALARGGGAVPCPRRDLCGRLSYFPGEAPGNLSSTPGARITTPPWPGGWTGVRRPAPFPIRAAVLHLLWTTPLFRNSSAQPWLDWAFGAGTPLRFCPLGHLALFGRHPHRSASGECSRSRSGVHGLRQMHCGLSRRRIGLQRPGPDRCLSALTQKKVR